MTENHSDYQRRLNLSRRRFLQQSLVAGAAIIAPPFLKMGDLAYGAMPITVGTPRAGLPQPWEAGFSVPFGTYNVTSGNLNFSFPIVSTDALDFSLTHNSQSTATGGPLGSKWLHTFAGKIVAVSGQATYVSGEGTPYVFTLVGSTYVAPTGTWRTLVKNSDNTWNLSKRDGDKYYHFFSDGRLDSIRKISDNTVVMQCTYDSSNNLTQVQNGAFSIVLGYTSGQITSVTDPFGHVYTLVYSSGKLSELRAPSLGGTVYKHLFGYNSNGVLNQITDPASQVWSYTFDSFGNLTGTSNPTFGSTTFTASTMTSSTVDANEDEESLFMAWPVDVVSAGAVSGTLGTMNYGFDSTNRLVAVQGATSDASVSHYDSNNNLTSQQLASGGSWTWTYDTQGRLLSQTKPAGESVTYSRDSSGRLTSLNRGGVAQVSCTYNSSNQLSQVTPGTSNAIVLTYDTTGRVSSIADSGGGGGCVFAYGTDGNIAFIQNLSGFTKYYYWSSNLLSQITDERGRATTFQRDSWGRITGKTYATTGNTSQTFQFDTAGNLSTATSAAGSFTFVSDSLHRVTSATGPFGAVTASYDGSNQQAYCQDPTTRRHNYTWNSVGCVATIGISDGTGNISYLFNANNQVTSCTYPNGIRVEYGYDTHAQLISVTHRVVSTSVVLASSTAVRDSVTGAITQITELPSSAVTAFTYDTYGKLTVESRTGDRPYRSEYTYNADGSLATSKRWENSVLSHSGTYSYVSLGLLSQVVDTVTGITEAYTWNQDRTLASFTGPGYLRRLEYNEEGQITRISKDYGGGSVVTAYEYAYDADGLLVWSKDYGASLKTSYVSGLGLLGGCVLITSQQALSGGSWTETGRYIYGLDGVIGRSGTYFHNSPIGGPFVATNSSGVSTGTALTDSYGVLRFGTGTIASPGLLPGRIVHEGITISVPSGSASILERKLRIC